MNIYEKNYVINKYIKVCKKKCEGGQCGIEKLEFLHIFCN